MYAAHVLHSQCLAMPVRRSQWELRVVLLTLSRSPCYMASHGIIYIEDKVLMSLPDWVLCWHRPQQLGGQDQECICGTDFEAN